MNASSTVNILGSGFSSPYGVAADGAGNVFVADTSNNGAVKEIVAGTGGAAAGTVNASSTVNPLGSGFSGPEGVAVDGAGNVLVAESSNNAVKQIALATPPSLTFGTQTDGTTSAAQPITVQNVGNAPLTAVSPGLSVAANFTQVGGGGTITDCASSFTLASGALCNLSVEFSPLAPANGTVSGSVVLTDNNLNFEPSTTQTIQLNATAVEVVTLSPASLPTATFGVPYSATVSANGGAGPYTYAVTAGALPAGLALASTGLVSGTPTTPGSFSFTVTATDTSSSVTGSQAYSLTVSMATPTLSFAIANQTFGAAPFTVTATSNSTGAITYSLVSGPATVTSAGLVTITGAGNVTIQASQAANGNYTASTQTASFTVNKAVPTLTWATPAAITYGTVLNGAELNAMASVAGTITYTPAAGTLLGGGTQTLSASFIPTDTTDYTTPATKTVSLVVNAAPTATVVSETASSITAGTTAAFTATVTSTAGTPTGSVLFFDGTVSLGSVNLTNGVASYSTTNLTDVSHTITAVYQANPDFQASTSNAVTVVVNAATPFTFSAAGGGSTGVTVKQGSSGTANLTLTPSPTFTGTVSLSCGGLQGIATCTVSPQSLNVTANSGPQSLTVTINTAQSAALNAAPLNQPSSPLTSLAMMLWLPGLLAAGFGVKRKQSPLQRRLLLLALCCLSLGAVAALSGCGVGTTASSTIVTPTGTFNYQIIGTSGTTTESIPGVLTVQ